MSYISKLVRKARIEIKANLFDYSNPISITVILKLSNYLVSQAALTKKQKNRLSLSQKCPRKMVKRSNISGNVQRASSPIGQHRPANNITGATSVLT